MKPTTKRAVRFADTSRTETKELPDNCTADVFCRHYYKRVSMRAVRQLIGYDAHDIEDLVQETFTAFLEKWRFGFETVSARKYLFGILRGQIGRRHHKPASTEKQQIEQASDIDDDSVIDSASDRGEQDYVLTRETQRDFRGTDVLNSQEQKMLRLLLINQQRQRNNKATLVTRYYEKQARAQLRERLHGSKFFQPANRFDRRRYETAKKQENKVTVYFLSPEELAKVNRRRKAG